MKINSRNKGAAGEREIIKMLNTFFVENEIKRKAERNLEQVRSGGYDVVGVEPFCIEVKRVENICISKAWDQVRKAAQNANFSDSSTRDAVPVLIYRKNREKWRVMLETRHLSVNILSTISINDFFKILLSFFKN